jgi:hypothetical protein
VITATTGRLLRILLIGLTAVSAFTMIGSAAATPAGPR